MPELTNTKQIEQEPAKTGAKEKVGSTKAAVLIKKTDSSPTKKDINLASQKNEDRRNPFKHSLPIKIKKIQAEKAPVKKIEEKKPGESLLAKLPKKEKKELVLPTFTVSGIVWGEYRPRAIIDNQVYMIGDMVNGAKILDITEKGVEMFYQEEGQHKKYWVTITKTGE